MSLQVCSRCLGKADTVDEDRLCAFCQKLATHYRRLRSGEGFLPPRSPAADAHDQRPDPLAHHHRLAVAFLLQELLDEHMALGELWRMVKSVRQSVIDASNGQAEDFVGTPACFVVPMLLGELFRGNGNGEHRDYGEDE